MDFASVYGSLIEIFPQVDTRILKAVAVEHPNDADEAASVVLSEIIPTLPPPPPSNYEFTQSQNKSKRERKLERELSGIVGNFGGCPVASDSKSSAYPSSFGDINTGVAPSNSFSAPSTGSHVASDSRTPSLRHRFNAQSTGFHVAPDSNSSAYASSSGTIPMSVAPSFSFNASSTGFHVASDSKSSTYSSPSETIPVGLRHRFNASSTDFHVAPDSNSSAAYASSSRTIPMSVAPSFSFNASSTTGFHVAPDSKSSAYFSSSGTIPVGVAASPYFHGPSPSTGFYVAPDSKCNAYSSSGTIPMGVAASPYFHGPSPSTGFYVAPDSKCNAYSSSGTIPTAPLSNSFNTPSTGFHVAPDSKSSAYSPFRPFPMGDSDAPRFDFHVVYPSPSGTTPDDLLPDLFKSFKSYPFPCEAQIGLNKAKNDDDTASVVSPITKEQIKPIRSFWDDIASSTSMGSENDLQKLVNSTTPEDNTTNTKQGSWSEIGSASANVVDGASTGDTEQEMDLTDEQKGETRQETKVDGASAELSDDKKSSHYDNLDDEYLDDYHGDLVNLQELAEEPNQQDSASELTPNVDISAESITSIGSENAVEKLVDLTTPGDNTTNIEEDSFFDAVPLSTNVVDETSNDDTELDGALNTSTNECNVDHLEEIIEDAKTNKQALATAMESVTNLMREVELQEKDAEKKKEEAAKGGLDTLRKVEKLKEVITDVKESNDTRAGEIYGERSILATEVKELESRLLYLSEERNKSIAVLDEIRESLEGRLEIAMEMKKVAEEEKKEKEDSALKLHLEQEDLLEKVVEESKLLLQEAEENSKLREFLMDRGQIVDSLQGEISVICQDVKLLKEKTENRVSSLTKSISSSRGSSISEVVMNWKRIEEESCSINKEKNGDDYRKELLENGGWEMFDKDVEL